jgi:hypothetical protein
MNPRIWRSYAFVFAALSPAAALAQTVIVRSSAAVPVTVIQGGQVIEESGDFVDEEPMIIEEGQIEPEAAKPKKEDKPTPRGERMKRNDYDRRPSTILKVWSTPVKPAEAPTTETQPADAPAEVAPAETQAAESAPSADGAPPAESEKEAAEKEVANKARNKAKEEAAKKKAEAAAIENEALAMQRMVTLGDWTGIKAYLATLKSKADKKVIYEHLLATLIKGPQQRPDVPAQGQRYIEKNRFDPADVLGLAEASALELTKEQLAQLGTLLRQSLEQGNQLDTFLATLRPRMADEKFVLQRRALARLLAAANELVAMGEFLPSVEDAEQKNDREGLNLLARHLLAQNAKDGKVEWLVGAWKVTQAALAAGEVDEKEKQEALSRAVDLAPRISKELGQKWLDESFTAGARHGNPRRHRRQRIDGAGSQGTAARRPSQTAGAAGHGRQCAAERGAGACQGLEPRTLAAGEQLAARSAGDLSVRHVELAGSQDAARHLRQLLLLRSGLPDAGQRPHAAQARGDPRAATERHLAGARRGVLAPEVPHGLRAALPQGR